MKCKQAQTLNLLRDEALWIGFVTYADLFWSVGVYNEQTTEDVVQERDRAVQMTGQQNMIQNAETECMANEIISVSTGVTDHLMIRC